MPVPKRKHSRSRRDLKHANKGLDFTQVAYCQTTQEPCAPHAVCLTSGYYKGVKVLRTKADRAVERAQKAKEIQDRRAVRQSMGHASAASESESVN